MRPIKLTMTAFGPYAKCEIVDFRDAIKNGLFGIYGSTGSGKSTIFSAMTFALFGEASKSEQDTATLRSDHAESNTLTEVEFIFEVGNKRYLIRRRPDQMRPAIRGGGETKETHKAWFFDITGLNVDTVNAKDCGKIIAEKKVGEVKSAVKDCLGYGLEQFKQIVLLPQGKFEIFLSSKTDVRLKILRELFDVSLYRLLSQRFKEQAKDAEETVRRDREVCAARLSQESYESPDALKDGIAVINENCSQAEKLQKQAEVVLSKAVKGLLDGEKLEEKFITCETSLAAHQELLNKIPERERLEAQLLNIEKAQALLDVDEALQVAKGRAREVKLRLTAAQASQEQAEKAKGAAKAMLDVENANAGNRDELRRRIETYEKFQTTLKDADTLCADRDSTEESLTDAQLAFENAEADCERLKIAKDGAEEKFKTVQTNSLLQAKLTQERTEGEQKIRLAQGYAEARGSLDRATSDLKSAKDNHSVAQQAFEETEALFDQAESALSAAQAIHLAEKLLPGEACSVCGSTEHPAPVTGTAESTGLDQAFRDARERRDEVREVNNKAAQKVSSAETKVKERKAVLERFSASEENLEPLKVRLKDISKQITNLGPKISPEMIEAEISKFKERVEAAGGVLDDARGRRDTLKMQSAVTKQKYDAALQSIPEDLRVKSSLEMAVTSLEFEHQKLLTSLKDAEEEEKRTRESAIAVAKDLEAVENTLKIAENDLSTASKKFTYRLAAYGFSQEKFDEYKVNIDQVSVMKVEIEKQKEALVIAQDRASTAAGAIKNMTRPDLIILQNAKQTAEEEHGVKLREVNQLKTKISHLTGLMSSISEELSRIEKFEADTASVRELAALFNGQNRAKLELETFAIGAMFDQVLHSANLRLRPMSNGRYTLEREIASGKGAARQGLGIRVYDIYTGKRRAIETLSGGETFIAALALALGLSDIVESTAGNIRLDAIFIDEGFGSLDTENDTGTLDQVLQTLQDLVGDHRAVGLISHVPLVQQAVPNGFFVRKTPTGSHIEVRSS